MGACQSQTVSSNPTTAYKSNLDAEWDSSLHGDTKTRRQKLAWHREGVPVTDVYDIIEIIGHGSMGEVAIVEKKINTVENASSRLIKIQAKNEIETAAAAILASKSAALTIRKEVKRRYACKTVNTLRMTDAELKEFVNEVDILRDLDHPNIVQLFEVYKVKRRLWIVTELCSGGDLTNRMANMTEADVVIVVEQILRAVCYMHKRHVCHRDIKLENIMYADRSPEAPIMLIDFGLSNKFTKGEKMLKACGTIYSAAPELVQGMGYTEQTDIWSIGVVTWVLLSETYPFLREIEELCDESKKKKLVNAEYVFGPEWESRKISKYGNHFVEYCFAKHPGRRWSTFEGLEYLTEVWIPFLESLAPAITSVANGFDISQSHLEQSSSSSDTDQVSELPKQRNPLRLTVASRRNRTRMDSSMLHGMQMYAENSELKKTILMTMAYTMDKSR